MDQNKDTNATTPEGAPATTDAANQNPASSAPAPTTPDATTAPKPDAMAGVPSNPDTVINNSNGTGNVPPAPKKSAIPLPLALGLILIAILLVGGFVYAQNVFMPKAEPTPSMAPTSAPVISEAPTVTMDPTPAPTTPVEEIDKVDTGASDSSSLDQVQEDINAM